MINTLSFFQVLLILLTSCNGNVKRPNSSEENINITKDSINNGTSTISGSINYRKLEKNNCDLIKEGNILFNVRLSKQKEEDIKGNIDFVKDFIRYYQVDSVEITKLKDSSYYKSILSNTDFLDLDFERFSYIFSVSENNIKNYGKCYLATFKFPDAPNSAQQITSIIINIERKEISIWHFEKLAASKMGIVCVFQMKGNLITYNLVYSKECDFFIPISRY